jgi:hypothetical protein
MKPVINSARPERRLPSTDESEIDSFLKFWPRYGFTAGDAP